MTAQPDTVVAHPQAVPQTGTQTSAATPPARAYSDAQVMADELDAVFRSSWMVAGLTSEVASPRRFLTTEIAGVPVVVTRDREGVLHAMANVCQHRGMVLAKGSGQALTLTCPNHAWTYALDGQLKGAPRSSHEEGFDCASIRLPRFAVHEWGQVVLVNLDPAAEPPAAELERVGAVLTEAGLDLGEMRQTGPAIDWSIACNWKIAIENYLECYHCGWVHRDFSQVFDVSLERYAHEPDGLLLCSRSPVKEVADRDHQQQLLVTDGPMADSHWFLLFPTFTVNVYPGEGAVELTWYWPEGPDTTGGRTVTFVSTEATPAYEEQVVALLTQVGDEDKEICESMHRGMRSGALERARVLPENERLITSFHSLLRERLIYQEVAR